MGDLLQAARDWRDAKEKQLQDAADVVRGASPTVTDAAKFALTPPGVGPLVVANGIMASGMKPSQPTAEDRPARTLPLANETGTKAAEPQAASTFMMPMGGGGGGGTSRASTSVTEGVKLSPQTTQLLDQSGQEQRTGIRHAGEAEQEAIDVDADQARRTANEMQRQQIISDLDPKALHVSHQIDEERQKLKDMQGDKFDSRHFQKSQTLGERLAWALSIGLGGFAAEMRGGPNTGAQLYAQAIQDDIDAQRSNISHKTELQKGLLGDLQQQFKDIHQQNAAGIITGMNIYRQRLLAEKAKPLSDIQAANTERELGTTDDILAQQHAKFDEATSNRVTKNYESVSGGAGGGGITPEQLADKRLEIIKMFQATGKPFTGQQVDQYLAQLYSGGGGQMPDIAKPGKGGSNAAGTAIASAPGTKSTAFDLRRYFPTTEAGKQMLTNEQRNAQVMASIHAQNPAARGLEAIQTIAGPYLIHPGDTQDVVDMKNKAFARDYGGAPQGATPAREDEGAPEDFGPQ